MNKGRIKIIPLILALLVVLPVWSAAGQGDYTILAGSYRQLENAEDDYQQLRASVVESLLDGLRIEKVGEYYTLRIGDFAAQSAANDFLPVVRQLFAEARVLQARIKPERVVKQLAIQKTNDEVADLRPEPSTDIEDAEVVDPEPIQQKTIVAPKKIVITPAGKVKKQITNKLAANFYEINQSTEYYTVQIGSFAKKGLAALEYDRLLDSLPDWLHYWLRIEKVQGFYTVRVGLYVSKDEAEPAIIYLKERFKHARLLYAYVKAKRVVRGSGANTLPGVAINNSSELAVDKPLVVQDALADNIPSTDITEEVLLDDDFNSANTAESAVDDNDVSADTVTHDDEESTDLPEEVVASKKPAKVKTASTRVIYNKKIKQQINDGRQPGFAAIKPPDDAPEFFTLQVSSFSDIALAMIEYDNIVQHYPDGVLDDLRIEFVKGFFTVRIGRFMRRAEVQDLAQILRDSYPRSAVLYAYILPARIQRQYSTTEVSEISEDDNIGDEADNKGAVSEAAAEITDIPVAAETAELEAANLTSETQDVIVDSVKTDQDAELLAEDNSVDSPSIPDPVESITVMQIDEPIVEEQQVADADETSPEPVALAKDVDEISAVLDAGNEPDPKIEPDVVEDVVEEVADDANQASEDDTVPEFSYEVVTVLKKDDQGDNIKMPSALFYDYGSDELFLINGVNNRIIVYGPDFFPQNSLGKGRGLDSPLGGFISPSGMVYITQAGSPASKPRLTILNKAFFPEKEIEMDFPDSSDFIPQRIAVGSNGDVFLTGLSSRKVLHLNADFSFNEWLEVSIDRRGAYAFSDGNTPERTALIKDVKVDKNDNVFLLSEETSKIYVFNNKRNFLFSFGVKGGAEGKMSRPRGMVIDEKRRCFYVVDYMRHTVLIFDFTGQFRYEFGGRGWGAEWFNYPVDITLGRNGQVIVADFFNQRAQVFNVQWRDSFPTRPAELWGKDL